ALRCTRSPPPTAWCAAGNLFRENGGRGWDRTSDPDRPSVRRSAEHPFLWALVVRGPRQASVVDPPLFREYDLVVQIHILDAQLIRLQRQPSEAVEADVEILVVLVHPRIHEFDRHLLMVRRGRRKVDRHAAVANASAECLDAAVESILFIDCHSM